MFVNCVAYENGRKLAEISEAQVHDYIGRQGVFIWMAVRDPGDAELLKLQQEFGLHELAVEDARHGHQRPKVEEYGDSLFCVLHTAELSGEELKVGEVDIFVDANYVLSVRNRSEHGFRDVRARCEREPELMRHGPGYVLYAILDAVVDRYFPVLDKIETEVEEIEEQLFANRNPRANIEALYYVKRKLAMLKHSSGPLLETVAKLHGGRVPHLCLGLGEYFRDVYDHLIRLNQSIDSLRDTVITAIQANLAMITIAESEVTKRLAAYAALFALPTMIAGIYGMNFRHMPELDWAFGYPLTIAVMAAIDVYLFFRFRKAGWL